MWITQTGKELVWVIIFIMIEEEYYIRKDGTRRKKCPSDKYHQYKLYPRTKDSVIEIKDFEPLQKGGRPPSKINNPKRFDKKAYMKEYKKRSIDTKNLTRNMLRIKTHRQECTAKLTPLCLKVFVTNQEDTVCLRCQNVRV